MKSTGWKPLLAAGLISFTFLGCTTTRWPAITEEPTALHTPGRWVWSELFTEDVAAASAFYGKVFDWEFHKADDGDYVLAVADGRPVAGMVTHVSDKDNGRSAQWLRLMSVDSPEKTVAALSGSGAEITLDPRRLEGRGEVAVITDPEGALFGIMHSDSGDPPDGLPPIGGWLWQELWADDVNAMADFYRGIGDYEVQMPQDDLAFGDDRQEIYLVAQGYPRAGIVEQKRDDLPSAWLPYVRVADLDQVLARATAAGAGVLVAPSPDIRGGRIAVFADPQGAPVGIAVWPDDEGTKP